MILRFLQANYNRIKPYLPGFLLVLAFYFVKKFVFLKYRLKVGTKYKCPSCQFTGNEFVPYYNLTEASEKLDIISAKSIKNMFCPNCFSSNRERHLFVLFEKDFIKFANKKILHFAPEKELNKYIMIQHPKEYVTADLTTSFFSGIKGIRKIDVTDIPFENAYFDIVICNHVLEHVIDDKKAMREISRILKPEGIAILLVPISTTLEKTYEDNKITVPKERERAFGQLDHLRVYAKNDYLKRLQNVGLQRIETPVVSEEEIEKFGLDSREEIFAFSKKN